jgi:ribosomal protein S14
MAIYKVLRPIEHDGKLYQPTGGAHTYRKHTVTRDSLGNMRDELREVAQGGEIIELTDAQAAQFAAGEIERLSGAVAVRVTESGATIEPSTEAPK